MAIGNFVKVVSTSPTQWEDRRTHTYHTYYCVVPIGDDGKGVPDRKKRVRQRSRGKHCPGDGPYTCRIASGYTREFSNPSSTLIYSAGYEIHERKERGEFGQRWEGDSYEGFSGGVWCRCTITNNQPGGWGFNANWTIFTNVQRRGSRVYWTESTGSLNSYGLEEKDAYAIGKLVYSKALAGHYATTYTTERWNNILTLTWWEKPIKLSDVMFGPAETREAGYLTRNHEIGLAAAFVDACDHLPTSAGVNNIANVLDIAKSFLSFRSGFRGIGSAAEAWLAYRYQYSTTVADLSEMSALAARLLTLPKDLRSNGFYRHNDLTYRVAIRVESSELESLVTAGERWGMTMSALNLWDLVPYSFIVDWFIPVSRTLEKWESSKGAAKFSRSCWCSIQRAYTNEYGFDESDYTRFLWTPTASEANLAHTSYSTRGITIIKRALDVLCLFS